MTTPTAQELLALAKPREHTARILLDQMLLEEHAELDARLNEAIKRYGGAKAVEGLERPPEIADLARQIDALQHRIEAEKTPFLFRGIGRRKWVKLLAEHPPTEAQLAEMTPDERRVIDYNVDTFPAVAIAASCVDPELTVDDVAAFEEILGVNGYEQLWTACLIANVGGHQDPKSLVAGLILRRNGGSATTAVNEESLEASSSVE